MPQTKEPFSYTGLPEPQNTEMLAKGKHFIVLDDCGTLTVHPDNAKSRRLAKESDWMRVTAITAKEAEKRYDDAVDQAMAWGNGDPDYVNIVKVFPKGRREQASICNAKKAAN